MRILILGACALALSAAPAFAETRTLTPPAFEAIEASGPYEVEYVPGEAYSVTLSGTPRNLDRTQVRVRDGVLQIKQRCRWICNSRGTLATIRITAPAVDTFDAALGVDVRARGVEANEISLDVSMGATMHISGACGTLQADVSMGGALRAQELRCRIADVDVSMGGDANVHATDSVNADASMGGSLSVAGTPDARRTSRSMGGSIRVQ